MNRSILWVASALGLAVLACSISPKNIRRLQTGPTETLTINEAAPEGAEVADLSIDMGAGELNVTGGGEALVEGEVRYNVAEWEPEVRRSGDSVTIRQGRTGSQIGVPDDRIVNEWDLRLGDVPMNLTINAGAYEGNVDLSGVPLRSLTINDGASSGEVVFNEPNPEEMDELEYRTGASSVTLRGLANANFSRMSFDGGAGSYTLDFSGELQRDARVDVTAGVSSVRIIVPAGTPVRVEVEGGLNDVETTGAWSRSGDVYEAAGDGPALTIHVDIGVGDLELVLDE